MLGQNIPAKYATIAVMNPLRFAIVGCGTIASTHAQAIREIADATLVAVCDPLTERATRLADSFSVATVFASLDTLLANPDIDAVCLCTPSGMHAAQAAAALYAGKHVLTEKPFDVRVDACDTALTAARETGKTLAVVSQHRFDPATETVATAIAAGKLGRIVAANAAVPWYRTQDYYDSGDWRGTWEWDGGGALTNQGVHSVDVLLSLAGAAQSVFAHYSLGAAHERIAVEDVLSATVRFESGAVGTVFATTAAYPGFPARIEIYGTGGTAIIEGDRLKELTLLSGERAESELPAVHAAMVARGGTAAARAEPVWGDSHRAQITDFVRAIRTGTPPRVSGLDGRRAVMFLDAVYRSARAGFPVTLDNES